MSYIRNGSAALMTLIAVGGMPTTTWAQSKPQPKAEETRSNQNNQTSASSDFEENRKLHTQKSKENNDKKGAK